MRLTAHRTAPLRQDSREVHHRIPAPGSSLRLARLQDRDMVSVLPYQAKCPLRSKSDSATHRRKRFLLLRLQPPSTAAGACPLRLLLLFHAQNKTAGAAPGAARASQAAAASLPHLSTPKPLSLPHGARNQGPLAMFRACQRPGSCPASRWTLQLRANPPRNQRRALAQRRQLGSPLLGAADHPSLSTRREHPDTSVRHCRARR